MIEVYLLTETIDFEAEKQADLIGKEYKPKLDYTQSWLNIDHVEMIIKAKKKDEYLIQFANSEDEVIAKIHPDEFSKIQKG